MPSVAQVQSILYSPEQHQYDIQVTAGEIVFVGGGCLGPRFSTELLRELTREATFAEGLGDYFYSDLLHGKKDGLVPQEENAERLQKEVIAPFLASRVPVFPAVGNHDGGNVGNVSHSGLSFAESQAKMDEIPGGILGYYQSSAKPPPPEAYVTSADGKTSLRKLNMPARYYFRHVTSPSPTPPTIVITLDSSLLLADEEQLRWLQTVVIPHLERNKNARIVLTLHHLPGLSHGNRVNAKDEHDKYPQGPSTHVRGNHHHQIYHALEAIRFPLHRVDVCMGAHEHTAEVHQTLDAATPELTGLPKISICAGNTGAESNKKLDNKTCRALPPGSDFLQSGFGLFRFALAADSPRADVQYFDATQGSQTAAWEQAYPLQRGTPLRYNLAAVFPDAFIKTEKKWVEAIKNCLKEGQFNLLKFLMAAQAEYQQDQQISLDVLDQFFHEDFFNANVLEAQNLSRFLTQLEKLIAYYLSPKNAVYCTNFYNKLCLLHAILRYAFYALTRDPSLTLASLNIDTVFYAGAAPAPATARIVDALEGETDDPVAAEKDGGIIPPTEIIPSKTKPKTIRPITNAKHWASDLRFTDLQQKRLIGVAQNAIRQYLCAHTSPGDHSVMEYLSGRCAHPSIALPCLLYQLLEKLPAEENPLLLMKTALKYAPLDFQWLVLDTLAENSIAREIFGSSLKDLTFYGQVHREALRWNPEHADREAKRQILDNFFELSKEEQNRNKTYTSIFQENALINMHAHFTFRVNDLLSSNINEGRDNMSLICFDQLAVLENKVSLNPLRRMLHSIFHVFNPQHLDAEKFNALKQSFFQHFWSTESKHALLLTLNEQLSDYFEVNNVTGDIRAKQDPNLPHTTTLARMLGAFAMYLPDAPADFISLRDNLQGKEIAKPYLYAPRPPLTGLNAPLLTQ